MYIQRLRLAVQARNCDEDIQDSEVGEAVILQSQADIDTDSQPSESETFWVLNSQSQKESEPDYVQPPSESEGEDQVKSRTNSRGTRTERSTKAMAAVQLSERVGVRQAARQLGVGLSNMVTWRRQAGVINPRGNCLLYTSPSPRDS